MTHPVDGTFPGIVRIGPAIRASDEFVHDRFLGAAIVDFGNRDQAGRTPDGKRYTMAQ